MRVISGKYKGRRLIAPKGSITRPTTDKIKEAMFGAIQFDIAGAYVLDAFAGSGALGIEALSRGAAHVDFVEKNIKCIATIKDNLKEIASNSSFDVHHADVLKKLSMLKQYDLVFLDPPYDDAYYARFLTKAHETDILNNGCILVMECRKKFDFL